MINDLCMLEDPNVELELIGRARNIPDYWLTAEDYRYLMDFIRDKCEAGYPVSFGCCHFLGFDYEREVRDWYWTCISGISVASIMTNGDIAACLDIERNEHTIFGNIRTDRLRDIWERKYGIYRNKLSAGNENCRTCEYEVYCRGGAAHTWNYEQNRQRLCLKGVLFS